MIYELTRLDDVISRQFSLPNAPLPASGSTTLNGPEYKAPLIRRKQRKAAISSLHRVRRAAQYPLVSH